MTQWLGSITYSRKGKERKGRGIDRWDRVDMDYIGGINNKGEWTQLLVLHLDTSSCMHSYQTLSL